MVKQWKPYKYNIYKLTTEHGVSKKIMGRTAKEIRTDFEKSMPGVKIKKIELWG